jgi:RNA polymerase sigma factor (sigma-70 family)
MVPQKRKVRCPAPPESKGTFHNGGANATRFARVPQKRRRNQVTSGPLTQASDETLVEECLAGNQTAWTTLVARYKNLVYSVPVRYRMPQEDASDVFQQVWLTLFSELPRLRQAGSLRAWLVTVATHRCNHLRRRQLITVGSEESVLDQMPSEPAPDGHQQAEKEQAFREAITRIPERCQKLVRMLFYEEPPLPYAQVAERLGLAEGSIGFIRGRCLQKLKAQLQKMGF